MKIYQIKNLYKYYDGQSQPANENINFDIYQGEVFGLLGDNGAGKSTLIKQLVNLEKSTSGDIFFQGNHLSQLNPMCIPTYVGYMPQRGAAFNNLTVSEAIYFTAYLRGFSRNDAKQERQRLLSLWQLEKFSSKPIARLSGGQMRLTQLAVTMAASPPVLILDEPTNDLDPQRRKQVWNILRESNESSGTTIIFITHDAIEAEKIIQRVGIMSKGKLITVGRPSLLKETLNQKVRLDISFNPDKSPTLPPHLQKHVINSGHWLVYLEKSEIDYVLYHLNMNRIEDFHLYSTTLEDLYLHYTTASNETIA